MAECSRRLAQAALLVSAVLLSAACTNASQGLFFETRSVTQGSFRGIEIGGSKEDTVHALRKLGISGAKPIPGEKFIVNRGNIGELQRLRSAEGVRLMNYRGLAIDLFFEGGRVTEVRKSVPAEQISWFHQGESMEDAIRELQDLLNRDEALIVIPIVKYEGNGWASFEGAGGSELQQLLRHDAWQTDLGEDKPRGAMVELHFADGKLSRIDYRRARVPLE